MARKKERKRRLWLNITQKGVKGITRREFIKRLLRSISDGTYELPEAWKVTLHWRNTVQGRMKRGPWTKEMRQSAKSSPGWDIAVGMYLRRKL